MKFYSSGKMILVESQLRDASFNREGELGSGPVREQGFTIFSQIAGSEYYSLRLRIVWCFEISGASRIF